MTKYIQYHACAQESIVYINDPIWSNNRAGIYAINYATTSATLASISYPKITYPKQTALDWTQTPLVPSAAWSYQYYYLYAMQSFAGSLVQPPETDAEIAERVRKTEERLAQRKAAEQRAEHLLFSILTPAQVKQYSDDQYFDVPIIDRVYRIRRGVARNIELIEGGKRTALLCAHPVDAYDLPIPDVMLSQLLALQANEQEFLRIANRTVLQ